MDDPEQAENEHSALERGFPPWFDGAVWNYDQRDEDDQTVEDKRFDKGGQLALRFGSRQSA